MKKNIKKLEALVDNLTKTYGGDQYKKLLELISGLFPNAWYATKGSHYGVGLRRYLHCTSEIRRGPDIVNEHALEVCYDKVPTEEEKQELREAIENIAIELNATLSQMDWFVKDYKRVYQKRR